MTMIDSITLEIPLPITTNAAYRITSVGRGKRATMYLTPEGNAYKEEVMIFVASAAKVQGFEVDVLDYLGWEMVLIPATTLMDIDGGIKLTQDAIAAALGINDRIFLELKVKKLKADRKNPRAIITIYKVKGDQYAAE